MLFHLVNTKSDTDFKAIYRAIQRAFWPEDDYISHVTSGKEPKLPAWDVTPSAAERAKQIAKTLGDILEVVARTTPLYAKFPATGADKRKIVHYDLPFVDRYHKYFAQRQWTTPLRNPRDKSQRRELFRLTLPAQKGQEEENVGEEANYSKNEGDYNHFMNVVAATARLIDYFTPSAMGNKSVNNVKRILNKPGRAKEKDLSARDETALAQVLAFDSSPDKRTFILLLAAFYHDIGKTVVYHRHSMEGASILAGHTSTALLQLGDIVKGYGVPWSFEFDRDDLLHVATLVYYHDQFGTLSTGEAGYLRLVDIVDRFKRASTTLGRDDRQEQIKLSKKHLFDLWLLNVADIMVSLHDKWKLQKEWLSRDGARKKIEDLLLKPPKAGGLVHDLFIALNLLEEHNENWHSDNLSLLQERASAYANRHVVERISRLIYASFVERARERTERAREEIKAQNKMRAAGPLVEEPEWLKVLDELDELNPQVREIIILRCIQSVSNFAEFSLRFAWIGQMDYALGFFRQIADHAIECVIKQFCGEGPPTGWVNNNQADKMNRDRRNRMNAEFLTDNFASTVVQILEYLLFREQDVNHLRNIEFEDASKRLTPEKIDKIIGLEGPYRARRSIELMLQTIFVY